MARPVIVDVAVPANDLSYSVLIGEGMLDRVGRELRHAADRARKVAIISDDNVMPMYGERVMKSLAAESFEVHTRTVAAGEASKSAENLLWLTSELVELGFGRNDAVVALGGGVVGDLAGFTAASFMRGIAFVQCPTSLLAQVDASVGGKVAVDLPAGKNLMGAFHFPRAVLIDPVALSTLPDVELGNGLAEMLKHGALFSSEHWQDLLDQADAIYGRDEGVLRSLVATSVALKAACVSRDPHEQAASGKGRVLLNLGHTVGHAIESASNYGMGHGQAVGLGLRAAARIAHRLGMASASLEDEVASALRRLRLQTDLDRWLTGPDGALVERALRHDKKRAEGMITYIALPAVADPRVVSLQVPEILRLLRAP